MSAKCCAWLRKVSASARSAAASASAGRRKHNQPSIRPCPDKLVGRSSTRIRGDFCQVVDRLAGGAECPELLTSRAPRFGPASVDIGASDPDGGGRARQGVRRGGNCRRRSSPTGWRIAGRRPAAAPGPGQAAARDAQKPVDMFGATPDGPSRSSTSPGFGWPASGARADAGGHQGRGGRIRPGHAGAA